MHDVFSNVWELLTVMDTSVMVVLGSVMFFCIVNKFNIEKWCKQYYSKILLGRMIWKMVEILKKYLKTLDARKFDVLLLLQLKLQIIQWQLVKIRIHDSVLYIMYVILYCLYNILYYTAILLSTY